MRGRSRGWLATGVIVAGLMHFGSVSAWAAPGSRPNVIVVLSDDQGYGDFSCHGNPVLKTPNLDRLHGQSVRLTDFHVAPMCTPTRGELLTGLDACTTGLERSASAGRSMPRRGIPMMPEIFAAGGYRTGHFGKWHLGDSYPNLPHQRGFRGNRLSHRLGHHLDGRRLEERLFQRPVSPQGRAEAVSRLLHRRLVRPGDGLDAKAAGGRRALLSLSARPTPRTARLGARQIQGAVPAAKGPPPSSA